VLRNASKLDCRPQVIDFIQREERAGNSRARSFAALPEIITPQESATTALKTLEIGGAIAK
jgi:hypothetical protein